MAKPGTITAKTPIRGTPQPLEDVQDRIRIVRGLRVLLDEDLSALFDVPTKRLNEQVRRNADRFPVDFAFQLTTEEWSALRSQNATSTRGHGGRRYQPWVFSEHGVVMAASVLNSPRAIEVSVFVVRAFVQLRRMASEVASLSQRLENLEQETARRFQDHDGKLQAIFQALRELLNRSQEPTAVPAAAKRPIGFRGQKK